MFVRPAFAAALVLGSTALASPQYPTDIQTKYMLSAPPPQSCTLCHPGSTGTGTATAPLARALQARGLTGGDTTALNMALDTLETDMVDSDSDGVIDVQELRMGSNPNVADQGTGGGMGGGGGTGGGPVVLPPLTYGCGANVAPELIFLLALVPLARRRIARR